MRGEVERLREISPDLLLADMDAHYRAMYDVALAKRARHQDLFDKRMIARSLLDDVIEQASAAVANRRMVENQVGKLISSSRSKSEVNSQGNGWTMNA